jgi:DNA mismatch endonuclease, patch repair protein
MIRTPSFTSLQSTSEFASRVGRGNRARNTRPELLLSRALKKHGIRYKLHEPGLAGKPDILLPRQRIAIFCDGDFWHGRRWAERRKKLSKGANADYWIAKISRNMERARQVDRTLRDLNWRVIRVWESDIIKDADAIASEIARFAQSKPAASNG